MDDTRLDDVLRTRFAAVRQQDAVDAPTMAQVLARSSAPQQTQRTLLPHLAFAAVLIIGLGTTLWWTSGHTEPSLSTWQSPTTALLPTPPSTPVNVVDMPRDASIATWESPTHFLLPSDTPPTF